MIFRGFQRGLHTWLYVAAVASAVRGQPADQLGDILRTETPDYSFSERDEKLLDAIQHGCFLYLWNECSRTSGIVKDRRTNPLASTAGVGFQLSALPIGVERQWITRKQGQGRALTILRTLWREKNNRHDGVYAHFLDADTAGLSPTIRDNEASTVDHALLLAGAMPAAQYFGGEVAEIVAEMSAQSNWGSFAAADDGFISLAWRPKNNADMAGEGSYLSHGWYVASDEERLVYFLAAGCPTAKFAVNPREYYRTQRTVERHREMQPFVVSWNGALFTYFFSHCWINYRDLAADDPTKFDIRAPRVDWFENSRRAVLTHRQRCIEMAGRYATLAPDRWGLSPCMGFDASGHMTYIVQDVQPNLSNHDAWHEATVAPYAAGCAIMFAPEEAILALRAFRDLQDEDGKPLVWRDPQAGGYGFADSFNLDQHRACDDNVAIDVGPMILAIENIRTGLIWELFMKHEDARRAVERLRLSGRE